MKKGVIKLVEEFTYKLQVRDLSNRNKISENKSRNFIKEYRRLLKGKLQGGNKVSIVGIAEVWPSVRESVNEVFRKEYGFDEQVRDLKEVLGMGKFEVSNLLTSYIRILILKLQMGYGMKVPGVFSIKPDIFGDLLGYSTRLSPTLEKPDEMVLEVRDVYGNVEEKSLVREDIIFRLGLDEDLGLPNKIRYESNVNKEVRYISDDILG